MKDIQYHPLSDIFPKISHDDLKSMAVSIEEHGQQHPITLFEGKILDGRHRYEACKMAGVKPRFEVYRGNDPIGLVVAANLHRRHLDTSQRSLVAARLVTTKWGGDRKTEQSRSVNHPVEATKDQEANSPLDRTVSKAAETMNVSETSVKIAAKLIDEAPKKLVAAVEKGEVSLHAASQQMKAKEEKKEVVRDATGWPVPSDLVALWNRRNEVLSIMKQLAGIENTLREHQKNNDALFTSMNYNETISRLQLCHGELKASQLHAVCPTCSGRNRKNCAHCQGRGFLGPRQWQLVPSEIKAIRERASK